eukprot:CAMPEP_0184406208 /NCGR_PEP_ID=MMETSP0738-20130409/1395_1 /TAXON_ID=385413 /ORGANISM="Thalassiosira miniscula, Strain CCMP1093" /LENGTH=76 /DNA_ID=CAMNT_0026763001 /DNA_START=123 /DNA_END=349 /DNA_ORIENTATION=-
MTQTPAPPPPAPKPRPSLHLNWQDWLPYLEHSSASDAEKQRLIETIWQIMHAFVDLGWDLDDRTKTSGQSLDLTAA